MWGSWVKQQGGIQLNSFLLKNLIENHTIDGDHIRVDDSQEVLDLTAGLIEDDSETDFDCMVEQLRESDELTDLLKGMVRRSAVDSILKILEIETLSEKNLIETINRLLRANQ
jgi:hypothetical protein